MPATVEWEDMLAWPFRFHGRDREGIDCAGVAHEINVRAGLLKPGELIFPPYSDRITIEQGGVAGYVASIESMLIRLGDDSFHCREVGDFVTVDSLSTGAATHVLTLVSRWPRVWLTADRRHGVRVHDSTLMPTVLGAYRVRADR